MRLFIGIELTDKIKQTLYELQAKLKSSGIKGSWKLLDNMHLTLEFLGEMDPQTIKGLVKLLTPVQNHHQTFTLTFGGLGVFPSIRKPHTLWASVNGSTEPLFKLQDDIRQKLVVEGIIVSSKSFHPHITLCSKPIIHNTQLLNLHNEDLGKLTVTRFILFESKADSGKRAYIKLHEFEFTK